MNKVKNSISILAQNKPCDICGQYITEAEAVSEDFYHSRTKRKSDVFIHKHCWDSTYKVKGGT